MEWLGALRVDSASAPPPRHGHSMTKFAFRNIVVLFGGQRSESDEYLNDMHVLNLDNRKWTPVQYDKSSSVPAGRAYHTLTIISTRTLVLFGGDSHDSRKEVVALNDVWAFNFNTKVWKHMLPNPGPKGCLPHSVPAPTPRYHHTAVYHDNCEGNHALTPAIYVFGGDCQPLDTCVYCLRIADWSWSVLAVADPAPAHPVWRDQHAAAWIPSEGMLVVGGDGGGCDDDGVDDEGSASTGLCTLGFLSDVWILEPPRGTAAGGSSAPPLWRWRHVNLTMKRSLQVNRLLACAGHSLIQFESNPRMVMVWGGMRELSGGRLVDSSSVILDLEKGTSEVLAPCGDKSKTQNRRVQHSLLQFTKSNDDRTYLLLYGGLIIDRVDKGKEAVNPVFPEGCETVLLHLPVSQSAAALQRPRIRIPDPTRPRLAPLLGGSIVGDAAHGALAPVSAPPTPDSLEATLYAAQIPRGTPLTGRVLDSTEVGFFVSVIINDRECKGVLVVNNSTVRPIQPGTRISFGAPTPAQTPLTARAKSAAVLDARDHVGPTLPSPGSSAAGVVSTPVSAEPTQHDSAPGKSVVATGSRHSMATASQAVSAEIDCAQEISPPEVPLRRGSESHAQAAPTTSKALAAPPVSVDARQASADYLQPPTPLACPEPEAAILNQITTPAGSRRVTPIADHPVSFLPRIHRRNPLAVEPDTRQEPVSAASAVPRLPDPAALENPVHGSAPYAAPVSSLIPDPALVSYAVTESGREKALARPQFLQPQGPIRTRTMVPYGATPTASVHATRQLPAKLDWRNGGGILSGTLNSLENGRPEKRPRVPSREYRAADDVPVEPPIEKGSSAAHQAHSSAVHELHPVGNVSRQPTGSSAGMPMPNYTDPGSYPRRPPPRCSTFAGNPYASPSKVVHQGPSAANGQDMPSEVANNGPGANDPFETIVLSD